MSQLTNNSKVDFPSQERVSSDQNVEDFKVYITCKSGEVPKVFLIFFLTIF